MNGNIVGAQSVLVPPSPGLILDTPPNHDTQPDQDHETEISAQASSSESDVTIEEVDTTGSPSKRPSKGRYAAKKDPAYAGIKKNQKSTNKVTINKKLSGVIAAAQAAATDSKELDVVFRFLDLPPGK